MASWGWGPEVLLSTLQGTARPAQGMLWNKRPPCCGDWRVTFLSAGRGETPDCVQPQSSLAAPPALSGLSLSPSCDTCRHTTPRPAQPATHTHLCILAPHTLQPPQSSWMGNQSPDSGRGPGPGTSRCPQRAFALTVSSVPY